MLNKLKNRKAETLVETLVAVFIVAIASAMLVMGINTYNKARISTEAQTLKLQQAMQDISDDAASLSLQNTIRLRVGRECIEGSGRGDIYLQNVNIYRADNSLYFYKYQ